MAEIQGASKTVVRYLRDNFISFSPLLTDPFFRAFETSQRSGIKKLAVTLRAEVLIKRYFFDTFEN